jgi:hypothetical protein
MVTTRISGLGTSGKYATSVRPVAWVRAWLHLTRAHCSQATWRGCSVLIACSIRRHDSKRCATRQACTLRNGAAFLQAVNSLHGLHGVLRFIVIIIEARHCVVFWARRIGFITPRPVSSRSFWILSSLLRIVTHLIYSLEIFSNKFYMYFIFFLCIINMWVK